MACLGAVVGTREGYTLRACLSVGKPGYMVVRDSDGRVVSRTYRTEADARRGWRQWRKKGRDDGLARVLAELMEGEDVAEQAMRGGVA